MNIPSLPTDNLYKFIAIFGLVLLSISIYTTQSFRNKIIAFNQEINGIKEMSHLTSIRQENIQEIINEIFAEINQDTINASLKEKKSILERKGRQAENFNNEMVSLSNRYTDYVYEQMQLLGSRDTIIENHNKTLEKWLKWVGIFAMFFGFVAWYFKHQRFLDAERKLKGEKHLRKLKKSKKQSKPRV